MDWLNFIVGIVGVVVGSSLMFYRQNKEAKIIQNESALSAEWEKLYNEQKSERLNNAEQIRQLRAELDGVKAEIAMLRPLVCHRTDCESRVFEKKS